MANKFYETFFLFFLVFILTGCVATNPPPSESGAKQIDTKASAPAAPEVTTNEIKKLSKQEIIQLQQQLSDLGYKPGVADGKLGKGTLRAIKKFQQENNLAETGKTDTNTISMVEQKIKKRSTPPNTQTAPAPANTSISQDNTQAKQETEQAKQDNMQVDKNNDQSSKRIIVPGGLNNNKLNKLWKVAKTKCFDLRYTVANDDKETGNVVCVFATDAGQNMMLINFDNEGFLVTVKGSTENIPILGGMVMGELNKHKAQMDDALKAAAGINK